VVSERAPCGRRHLQVYFGARRQRSQRCSVRRFLRQVGVEIDRIRIERRQADSRNRKRIALPQPFCHARRLHGDTLHAAPALQADKRSGLLNDSCKVSVLSFPLA